MYRKGWRYYRDSFLFWMPFFLLLLSAGYALSHPTYWPLVLFFWFLRNPVRKAFSFAHPFRRFGWMQETHLTFREVTFTSRDGLTLFGRFLPSRNTATILLLHGLGGANHDMLLHAEFLASAGFGIFMIDLRAHGSSDGDTSTYGLREADDVAGAVDYLLTRVDVNGQKIGALGISLGAQAALRGTLKTEYIRALVLEGLNPSILSDHGGRPQSLVRWLNYPTNWLYYRLYTFMTGEKDSGVLEVIGKIAPRPILLIASSEKDIYFNRLFFQAAKEPRELWELPAGEHGAAILQDSRAYIQRVVDFFNKALL
ncbi:MAG TPA: alpha/beta fold hydrolase [Anaerolineales bacterium]|nr:alpha/beta fold hydrolase [Anaerolineales bacterium]